MERRVLAYTRERLTECLHALAAPRVRDSRLRHEIAFVRGVRKNPRAKHRAVLRANVRYAGAARPDAVLLAQTVFQEDLDPGFTDEVVEHRFGHMRLEMPFDRPAVLRADALEELEGVAADRFLATVVGPAEAAGHHAAQMGARLEE